MRKNSSIDIFRYVCAGMVVAIHCGLGTDISESLGFLFTQLLPRIAVPYFFMIAGYYYIQSLESGKNTFKFYVFKLLRIYVFWSLIYFAVDFINWGYLNLKGFIANSALSFFITGSYYHLWFFPALIFSVVITSLFYKLGIKKYLLRISFILYAIGCLGCSYKGIALTIPILNSVYSSESFIIIRRILLMGFPLFSAGILVDRVRCYVVIKEFSKKTQGFAVGGLIVLYVAEVAAVTLLNWQEDLVITFGLYFLTVGIIVFFLLHPLEDFENLSDKCRKAADFTYYAHPLVILAIDRVSDAAGQKTGSVLLFLLTIVLTLVLSRLVYWAKSKCSL